MKFVETPIFTRAIVALVTDEEYRFLQLALVQRPRQGAVIRGSGGLRKMRWALPGQGKRSAMRLIYFWDELTEICYMLYVYEKHDREDLTAQQLRLLSRLVREEFR